MAATELRRFDVRVMRDVFAAESGSTPGDVRFSFFGQGATVATATTIPTGSSQLAVYDAGALTAGSTVMVGLGGGQLAVTAINSRTAISLSNGTGASIAVSAGTRLFLVSDPVTVYTNASGTSSPSDVNSYPTTSSTTGAIWIPRPQFDQIGTTVAIDQASAVSKKTGSGSTLTWSHASSGSDRLVLVGVSWQDTADEESLVSATYDGTAMTLVASTSLCAIYSLAGPPTGSKSIVVTWSGSNVKGAVAAAISFTGVDQATPIASVVAGTGNSTTASATASGLPSMIFSLIGVDCGSSTVSLTAGSGSIQQWADNAGSSGALTLTQGAGSTSSLTGSTRAMSWTLGAARNWGLIAVSIRPKAGAAVIDQLGGATANLSFVDARNYADLQAAADDVAPGGTLFIPNGAYTVPSGGLIIRKAMTIQGEAGTQLFSFSNGSGQPVLVVEPGGQAIQNVTIRDLTLLNVIKPELISYGNYGIHCYIPDDGSKLSRLVIERVSVQNMGDVGIWLDAVGGIHDSFIVFATLRDVSCVEGRKHGLVASYTNLLNCYGCYFAANDGNGARVDISEPAFYACAFESNCRSAATSDGDHDTDGLLPLDPTFDAQLRITNSSISRVDGCHFETFNSEAQPVCKRAIVLLNSPCTIVSGCGFFNGSEAEGDTERGIYCSFSGDDESPGVVACSILPNTFTQTKVAIEIDGGSVAQDCVVFPQKITSGTGGMMLPTGVSDSGIVALGNRKLGSSGLARGVLFPPHSATSAIPAIGVDEVGYVLLDTTNKALRIWDGHNWLTVNAT